MGEKFTPVPRFEEDQDLIIDGVNASTNRKISPLARPRFFTRKRRGAAPERFDIDLLGSAFGLASGSEFSCAGATPFCENDCYSIEAERTFRGTGASMRRHFELLSQASYDEMRATCSAIINGFNLRCERMGVPESRRIFRWHWAGDIFSLDYARAISAAFSENPQVSGAIYTRVFQPDMNAVPELITADNLNVFLSTDPDNLNRAAEVYRANPDKLRFAFLGQDYTHAQQLVARMIAKNVPNFDPHSLTQAYVDEHGQMPFQHGGTLFCPELYPYGTLKQDGSRRFVDLTMPVPTALKAEQSSAEAEGREMDITNVDHRGACSHCMACYGNQFKHVVFVKFKEMHHVNGARIAPQQMAMAEVQQVPLIIKPKQKGVRAPISAVVEEPPSLFD